MASSSVNLYRSVDPIRDPRAIRDHRPRYRDAPPRQPSFRPVPTHGQFRHSREYPRHQYSAPNSSARREHVDFRRGARSRVRRRSRLKARAGRSAGSKPYSYSQDSSVGPQFSQSLGQTRARSRSSSEESDTSDFENARGQFHAEYGTRLDSGRYEYTMDLGIGTFGKVIGCYDTVLKSSAAIKVIRSVSRYTTSAKVEADILAALFEEQRRSRDHSGANRCVSLLRTFHHGAHFCMVFEQLGPSLLDEQKRMNYAPFHLEIIRNVGRQVLEGLSFLHERAGVVHTDIKMENILFSKRLNQDCSTFPMSGSGEFDIKLIDFGGATYRNGGPNDGTINTRQYRAPEVILELGWDYPSDIWCTGALLMEMFKGDLLFQPGEDCEHLALMERVSGSFPRQMRSSPASKTPESYFDKTGRVIWPKDRASRAHIKLARSIKDDIFNSKGIISAGDQEEFSYVMQRMLDVDPVKRCTAREALKARFFARKSM